MLPVVAELEERNDKSLQVLELMERPCAALLPSAIDLDCTAEDSTDSWSAERSPSIACRSAASTVVRRLSRGAALSSSSWSRSSNEQVLASSELRKLASDAPLELRLSEFIAFTNRGERRCEVGADFGAEGVFGEELAVAAASSPSSAVAAKGEAASAEEAASLEGIFSNARGVVDARLFFRSGLFVYGDFDMLLLFEEETLERVITPARKEQ